MTPHRSRWMCPEGSSRRQPSLEQVPGRSCGHVWKSCCSSLFLKDCTPLKGPMLEQFVKNCSLWEGPVLEMFTEDCLPLIVPPAGAGGRCEEKGVVKTKCYEQTTVPIRRTLALLKRRR